MIREMMYHEMPACCALVRDNWGDEAADRARGQMIEYFKGGAYAPVFYVAEAGASVAGGPIAGTGMYKVGGFAAFCPSMLMKDAYDLIWIAIDKRDQARGIGRRLTNHRLAEIRKRGGRIVSLMTQKPDYFARFGFEVALEMDSWHLMVLKLQPVRI
jgi:ribosomal protein S18 acetylase RimI-like enzyme